MKISEYNIKNISNYNKWHEFLEAQGINNFSKQEILAIDKTFVWFNENQKIIATGSIANNILKYIAIEPSYRDDGSLFNQVISCLINQAALLGKFHLFVFTKSIYVKSFKNVGFNLLAKTCVGALLETGLPDINDYIKEIPKVKNQNEKQVAAVVVNANPFTLGHKYLIKKASLANDLVYVFVVSQNVSLFSFEERFNLVKEGTSELKNVIVVPSKEYMVSYATYPAYFLKNDQNTGKYQAMLDALLFKNNFVTPLNIKKRYLGSEPYSKTTNVYNEELLEILPPQVEVEIIPRIRNKENKIITATSVREEIKNNNLEVIKTLVPKTTFDFIKNNLINLRNKIAERK